MQVRVTPSGFLDKDTDPQYVGQGNYLDATNIRHRQSDGNNHGGIMTVDGNSLAASIPAYTSSTRLYRVYIDVTDIQNGSVASHDGDLYLFDSTGNAYENKNVSITGTSLTSYRASLVTALDVLSNLAYGALFTHGAIVVTSSTTAYWDVETNQDTEWRLVEVGVISNLCEFRLVSEYIVSNGTFSPVGSIQLGDDLFVLSAGSVTNLDGTSEVSEVGVVYPLGSGYAYIRLLRSKQLSLHQYRNADIQIEKIGSQINLYWTDDFSKPRALYIDDSSLRVTDGLLYSNGGRYEYDSIDNETSFFLKIPTIYFSDIEVLETGGNLSSGNKRYTGRLLTEDLVSSGFVYPTNPVNVYLSSTGRPEEIAGDASGESTTKSVKLTLNNIPAGEYKYFELVALEYDSNAVFSKIVQRYKLDNSQTRLTVIHSDIGQDSIQLSNLEVLSLTKQFNKAKSMRLFDNRMVLSNLAEEIDLNLNEWAQQIEHSIGEDYIKGITLAQEPGESLPGYEFGEYMDPLNTYGKIGYMFNDTYRFGIQVQWKKTGRWSLPYWVDDIRFDSESYNIYSSGVYSRRKSFGGSVTSVNDLTDTITVPNHGFYNGQAIVFSSTTIGGLFAGTIYYVLNATQNTFQLTPIFGGTTPEDITSSGSGTVAAKKIDTNLTDANADYVKVYHPVFHNIDLDYTEASTGEKIRDLISAYRFVRSERIPEVMATGYFNTTFVDTFASNYIPTIAQTADVIQNAPGGGGSLYLYDRFFFYSPDIYFGAQYEYRSGDTVKILAPPHHATRTKVIGKTTAVPTVNSAFRDYSGFFVDPQVYDLQFATYTPEEHIFLDQATIKRGDLSIDYATQLKSLGGASRAAHMFRLTSSIPAFPSVIQASEYGNYYGQVFRDLGANRKYPANKETSVYDGTGDIFILSAGQNGVIDNYKVYGGDVFNQKSFVLLAMMKHLTGGGCGYGFYSQNVQNLQMIQVKEHDDTFDGFGNQFPQQIDKTYGGTFSSGSWGSGVLYWCEQWPEVSNQIYYNNSYNINSFIMSEAGYDENSNYDGELPTRIAWSAKKTLGSLKDSYRNFSPLDFADLDLTYGEISHHEVINNSFYTWQDKSFQRQYFRDASLVNAQSGSDIVVGSGSILGAPGQEYTSIGCSKKWSIVKGTNNSGKDTVYWFNDKQLKLMRFAQDGVNVISDRGMSTWFLNNADGYQNKQYPLTGQGIHGVWNKKYNEAVFTFLPGEGDRHTIVYDEFKNGFISFNTHYPLLYMPYNTGFFSPNPSNQSQIYIHNSGSEGTFYGSTQNGRIQAIMNYDSNMSKLFEAVQFDSNFAPNSITFNTNQHVSTLALADFESREDYYYSNIKNDATVLGVSTGDTSRLFGRWLKVDMSLASVSGGQKLINLIVKFRPNSRLYTQ